MKVYWSLWDYVLEVLLGSIGGVGSRGALMPDKPKHKAPNLNLRGLVGHKGIHGGFPKLGVLFWGPYNDAYRFLGSTLGSPYFGKLPYYVWGLDRDSIPLFLTKNQKVNVLWDLKLSRPDPPRIVICQCLRFLQQRAFTSVRAVIGSACVFFALP